MASPQRTAREIAAGVGAGVTTELFAGADLGVFMTGTVMLCEAPRHFQGKSAKGNPYSFHQRRLQVWTGNKAVPCSMRADNAEDLPEILVGVKQTFKVTNAQIRDGQLNFDLELAAQ